MTFRLFLLTILLRATSIHAGLAPFWRDAADWMQFRPGARYPLSGDMLNVTKCYCVLESSKHFDVDEAAGHYYQWIYYNFHEDTWLNLSRQCRTKETHRSRSPKHAYIHPLNDCLAYWRDEQHTPSCEVDGKGNTFCVTLDWEDGDWYSFNDQTRRKDDAKHGLNLAPHGEVQEKCNELCSYVGNEDQIKLEGRMKMLQGQVRADLNRHIDQQNDFLWSYIDVDYSVDDMCPDCKR